MKIKALNVIRKHLIESQQALHLHFFENIDTAQFYLLHKLSESTKNVQLHVFYEIFLQYTFYIHFCTKADCCVQFTFVYEF